MRLWILPFFLTILLPGCREPVCEGDPLCAEPPACPDGACAGDTPADMVAAVDCPAAETGDLVLNEILADPSGADVNGDAIPDPFQDEFVEIVNRSDSEVDVGGTSILVNGRIRTQLTPRCLGPGQALVVFGGGQITPPALVSESNLKLSNAGAAVAVGAPDGAVHDQWTYGKEADGPHSIARVPDVTGAWTEHPALEPDAVAHSAGRCVNGGELPACAPPSPPADGDVGDAPPEQSACPPVEPGELVINEVLADPGPLDANGDGEANWREDEFVELLLVADEERDLAGAVLEVDGAMRAALPVGCQPPGGGFVFFAGGSPDLDRGPLVTVLVADKSLGLRNAGDTVSIRREGEVLDQVTYGEEGGQDQSLTRYPDGVGSLVLHATVSAGAPASPGACVAGDNLSASCPAPDGVAGP